MSRRDDINTLYRPSIILERICLGLFITNTIISLISVCANCIVTYLTISLVTLACLYMALSIINDGVYWFRAERARRKNSIQVAYHVRLDQYDTDSYYNNNIDNPDLSYAANQFESIFFTKEICEKMVPMSIAKLLIAVVVLIISCRLVATNEVLLVIAETVFSAYIIEDSIRLFIYTQRVKGLYDEVYHEFVTVGISKKEQIVWLRWFCVEYESIKAHYRIRLSESLYKKLNPSMSKEWNAIMQQAKISKAYSRE